MYNLGMPTDFKLEDLVGKSPAEIYRILDSREGGLSEAEALRRLRFYGVNEFRERERIRPVRMFLSKLKNPILITLFVAAIISALAGSTISSLVIFIMIFLSAVIDFTNTYRSERAVEELQSKVKITAAVTRDGKSSELAVRSIVPGDIITLAAGDLVPADSVFLEGHDLFLNESGLTGESLPAEKSPGSVLWLGTSVVSGSALALAAATGKKTRLGQISKRLSQPKNATAFDLELRSFSFFIFRITIILVTVVLFFGMLAEHRSPLEVLLFAIAIAVGLAPELLPMIVTANLARGAVRMSKGGVIVRKLSAIHDLGSVDVLATDKTGTLTEDKIALMRAVDGTGQDSDEVFFWGYLSSFNLTAVRGAMDRAIQEFKHLDAKSWQKLDELPFDYERRRDTVVVQKLGAAGKVGAIFGRNHLPIIITKGAPEAILSICATYGLKKARLTDKHRAAFQAEEDRLSADGFRVLGLAVKQGEASQTRYEVKDEAQMTFLGFLAFLDPPKKSAGPALKQMAEYGIAIKIITGDHHLVAQKVASELDLKITGLVQGEEIAKMGDLELQKSAATANLFTRVTPEQKERIVNALRANGHVVAYLGDGANDLLSLKAADVGISVDNAVDVAKDGADIILLRKGLQEIVVGVLEGRKTFGNIFKYLMMALSSNFGNMASMPVGSLFLPFLPMTAPQILLNNFLYDSSQLSIPFDRVDDEFLKRPKRFSIHFLRRFMLIFGPLSSVFDIATFLVVYLFFHSTGASFQTAWFLESIATQVLVVNTIRTRQPIFRSLPGRALFLSSLGAVLAAWILPFTPAGSWIGLVKLPLHILAVVAGIVVVYLVCVEIAKHFFYRAYGHLVETDSPNGTPVTA